MIFFEGTGPDPVFHTVQGEGVLVGRLSTFIRFYGCNQSCSWCDTKPSWSENMGQRRTVQYNPDGAVFSWEGPPTRICATIPGNNVVITGGNPMLPEHRSAVRAFARRFSEDAPTLTIETNAFGMDTVPFDEDGRWADKWEDRLLWSLSPKLASLDVGALTEFLEFAGFYGNSVQLKLVLTQVEDLAAVESLVGQSSNRVKAIFERAALVLQPEWSVTRGISQEVVGDGRLLLLRPMFRELRVLPQVHKSLRIL